MLLCTTGKVSVPASGVVADVSAEILLFAIVGSYTVALLASFHTVPFHQMGLFNVESHMEYPD